MDVEIGVVVSHREMRLFPRFHPEHPTMAIADGNDAKVATIVLLCHGRGLILMDSIPAVIRMQDLPGVRHGEAR